MDFKINRKMKYENLSRKDATTKIKEIDKERSEYYKYFTAQDWKDKSNYDISIDSSKLGVEKTIDLLEDYIKSRIKDN